jgi:hypothetical protein
MRLWVRPRSRMTSPAPAGRRGGDGRTASSGGGRNPMEPETDALLGRFTTGAAEPRKQLINTLISSLKAAGVWQKLDALYVMAAADEQSGQRNWKADTFNLAPVSAPTFTPDQGYAGDGATSYLNTGFVPSTNGVNFTLNSATFGVWSRTNSSGTMTDIGCRTASTTAQTLLQLRIAGDLANYRINQSSAGTSAANADSSGMIAVRRSGASANALFRNGASIATGTSASTVLSEFAMTIGALNTGGVISGFTARQYAAAFIGASLSDAENTAFYNALLAYLTAVGAA